jgi:hypothetical protein
LCGGELNLYYFADLADEIVYFCLEPCKVLLGYYLDFHIHNMICALY